MANSNFDKERARTALERINTDLEAIKEALGTYMSTFHEPDAKIVMFIEDKKKSPSRGQSEEIEPDFIKMKFMDPEL